MTDAEKHAFALELIKRMATMPVDAYDLVCRAANLADYASKNALMRQWLPAEAPPAPTSVSDDDEMPF